jgi:hypothetical protein
VRSNVLKTRSLALLVAGLSVALAAVAAACDDNNNDNAAGVNGNANNPSNERVDALAERMQRNEMMYGIILIDGLGLHEMDEEIAEGDLQFYHTPTIRTLIRLLALTDWSDELQADADALREEAVLLLAALRDGDAEAAAPHAQDAHEGWHDFSDAVWEVLAGHIPADEGGPAGHGHDDDNGHGDDDGHDANDGHGEEDDDDDDHGSE